MTRTPALPWPVRSAHIVTAAFLAVAGDTVQVVAGTYAETVEPRFSGTLGQPDHLHCRIRRHSHRRWYGTGSAFRLIKAVPIYVTINGFHIGPTAETGIYVSAAEFERDHYEQHYQRHSPATASTCLAADHVTVSNNTVTNAGWTQQVPASISRA